MAYEGSKADLRADLRTGEDTSADQVEDKKGQRKLTGKKLAGLAKKAGQSLEKFAKANIHTDGEVGKLARMYYTLQMVHGGGASRMDGSGDPRTPGQKLYQIG